jgi:hypothetical protein
MVVSPVELRIKNHCASVGQQKFTGVNTELNQR